MTGCLIISPCNVTILYLRSYEMLTQEFAESSWYITYYYTAQKMKFSVEDFFSKCGQIRRKLRIWSHLLKKSFMENFILCAVHRLWLSSTLLLITHDSHSRLPWVNVSITVSVGINLCLLLYSVVFINEIIV